MFVYFAEAGASRIDAGDLLLGLRAAPSVECKPVRQDAPAYSDGILDADDADFAEVGLCFASMRPRAAAMCSWWQCGR